MQLETRTRLSYYKELTEIDEEHRIKLVQHVENKRLYVLKSLTVYDIHVYEFLAKNEARGIPHITEIIEDDCILYIVEEYIAGRTLRDLLDEIGPLSEKQAAQYIGQLCEILRPLHANHPPIVHRDIKPSNIIVTADNLLYLIDFNAAKETDNSKNEDTVLFGTVGYAAPEQYGFSAATPSADIFALGILLNEMLTGTLPGMKKHDGTYKNIIRICTHLDPKQRYVDAQEFQEALQRDPLPTGLRSPRKGIASLTLLWYMLLIPLSTLISRWIFISEISLEGILIFLFLLMETLFLGNYRGIQHKLPLVKQKKRPQRVLGIFLWSLILGIICAGIFYMVTAIRDNLISGIPSTTYETTPPEELIQPFTAFLVGYADCYRHLLCRGMRVFF